MTTFSHYACKTGHDVLAIKTNQHVSIKVVFKDAEPWIVDIDTIELGIGDEVLHGLFVGLGDEVISLAEIVNRAAVAYPKILKEDERNARDSKNHVSAMSWGGRYV